MPKGMAVCGGECAGGGGAHVGEDERGGGFRGEAGEVDAVPSGGGGGEEAGRGAEGGVRGVVAYAEAVAVVGTAGVLWGGGLVVVGWGRKRVGQRSGRWGRRTEGE